MFAIEESLPRLVQRAVSLGERSPTPASVGGVASGLLGEWSSVVAGGRGDLFARRLEWDGWSRDCWPCLAPEPNGELPAWAKTLREAFAVAEAVPPPEGALVAFGTVLATFMPYARRVLWSGRPDSRERFTPAATAQVERALLSRLSEVASPALHEEFLAFRKPCRQASGGALAAFSASFMEGRWGEVLERYPVLARLIGTVLEQWLVAAGEVLDRLEADASTLAEVTGVLGRVTDAAPDLSDPHRHGRRVWRLTFENGRGVVYKPRPLGVEFRFDAAMAWLATHGGLPAGWQATRRIERDGYGWEETVVPAPCADAAALERFFLRIGGLVAMLYALGGTDVHAENLIAAGEHPRVLDLEGLFQPKPVPTPDEPFASYAALAHRPPTVADTGVIEMWIKKGDSMQDWAAVARFPPDGSPALRPGWLDVDTDEIQPGPVPVAELPANLPLLDGQSHLGRAHAATIVAGFEQAYDAIVTHREVFLAPDGPLEAFAGQQIRFFFRATSQYDALQRAGLVPSCLVDGLQRSFALDRVSRTYLALEERHPLWRLTTAERGALERLDVPAFFLATDATDLDAEGTLVRGCFPRSGLDDARVRIRRFGPVDRALQSQTLGLCLAPLDFSEPSDLGSGPLATREDFLARAAAMAEWIAARALPLADGSRAWLSLTDRPKLPTPGPNLLGIGLMNGSLGLALFLAAAARATGRAEWRDLALAAVRPVCEALRADAPGLYDAFGPDGVDGLASLAYGLARLALLADAPELQNDARAAAGAITPASMEALKASDVLGGLAGVVLALLAAERLLGDPVARAGAIAAGSMLLARRVVPEGGRADHAWLDTEGKALAGFSHGQAGIAVSLARLAATTGDLRFREAAMEAIRFENTRFVPRAGNWAIPGRTIAATGEPWFMTSWCHGAPGVALGRIEVAAWNPVFAADLDTALATTSNTPTSPLDWLCCGNFGRTEILIESARVLARPSLAETARAIATARLGFLPGAGEAPRNPMDLNMTFLRGLPGVGWALLRLAGENLPFLLRWD